MTEIAVKFVEGSPDIVEGLILPWGGPRNGRDLTGTAFVKGVTDFCMDWFPDGGRPGLYRHGLKGATKAMPIGREIGGHDDDRGHWLQAQLDTSHAYWAEVKALVDQGKLFLSSGAVDHLVDVDEHSGAIKMWPWVEWSLVPNPANPDQPAVGYAVKSLDGLPSAVLAIIATKGWMPEGTTAGDLDDGDFAWLSTKYKAGDESKTDGRKFPYKLHGKVDPDGWKAAWSFVARGDDTVFAGGPSKAAVIKKLLADKPKGIDTAKKDSEAAWDASMGASTLSNLISLLGDEADELSQAAMLRIAIDAVQRWITAETAEIGTAPDDAASAGAFLSVKAGARNSATDAGMLKTAHNNIASVLSLDCAPDAGSGKSADVPPVSVLAVKAGEDMATVSADDLATMTETLASNGLRAVKEALHIYD